MKTLFLFSFLIIPIIIILLFNILYLLTLQKTLKEISLENRQMEPGYVWLNLIPVFQLYWQFIVIIRIADSLKAEYLQKEVKVKEERPGLTAGILYCSCSIISGIVSFFHLMHAFIPLNYIPIIQIFASVIGLVFWIIYWVKIEDYRMILKQTALK